MWNKKGCTLSDKSARDEFGLTQEEIYRAIDRGELRYRMNNIYGNPFLRLIRSEVEALVEKKRGGAYVEKKKVQKELAQVERDLRALRTQTTSTEQRRAALLAQLEQMESSTKAPATRRGRKLRTAKRGQEGS